MSKVIMMCGVCGSGKTTYAKKKEKEGYIRLSIDALVWWSVSSYSDPDNQYEELSEKIEAALRKKMLGLIKNGENIILDFSFWNKESRDYYKKIITNAGGTVELIYLKASKETLKKRLRQRNLSLHANSPFVITDEILEHHYNGFQEPHGEGEIVLVQQSHGFTKICKELG